ncbi:retropepsin-like aspartic protease family protein [Alteromonas lipolytica]|uniref:Peptidase A2 domain-containing protein n=1 Tax=Alteromonas lipolytica TaxID=1856405 RepID=A0A1E8FFP5_9ALTE|nr:retropepsin-like aspartic protease [Alteromonas lipolytica]OFI34744.1 hypothetical protein BFC17_14285 [Alteromonas lipolytica]GGF53655.1 hypothetical protein GCM10011338_02250 [Alteromonas lipolytica]
MQRLTYTLLLSLCLACSIALNIYLLWPQSEPVHAERTSALSDTPISLPENSDTNSQPDNVVQKASRTTATETIAPQQTSQPEDAQRWLNNGEFARVERYLIETLREQPDSPALLLLEADFILATQPLSTAVLHFYSLQELTVFNRSQRETLINRTNELVANTVKALYNAGDWDLLAQFIEPLFQLNSTDETLALKLAEAYARQQKFTLMEDVLANLNANNAGARSLRQRFVPDPEDSSESTEQTEIASVPQDVTRLALTRYGDQYIASTEILNHPAALLLDTGASSTAISRELYFRLRRFNRIPVIGLFDVRTAAGPIRSPLVRIESFTLGPYKLRDIGVFVMPEDAMQQADGLLGMNVLKQFHFQLDQNNAELLLSPRL